MIHLIVLFVCGAVIQMDRKKLLAVVSNNEAQTVAQIASKRNADLCARYGCTLEQLIEQRAAAAMAQVNSNLWEAWAQAFYRNNINTTCPAPFPAELESATGKARTYINMFRNDLIAWGLIPAPVKNNQPVTVESMIAETAVAEPAIDLRKVKSTVPRLTIPVR